jgi:hypothetical protein
MATFNTIKQLEAYINRQMRDVLKTEVAEKIKEVEQRNIQDEVYEGYVTQNTAGEPWKYQRRRTNGGLQDKKNMKSNVKILGTGQGVELNVENVTKGKDDNFRLDTLIEYGDGTDGKEYTYKENRDNTADQYLQGRPFTQETVKELELTNEHVHAFKNGLKSKGIDIT